MDVDRTAAVCERDAIDVDASPDVVWSTLTDLLSWPAWMPAVRSVTADGPFRTGTTFRWKAGPGTIVSEVLAAEPGLIAGWRGRTLGIDALHVWRFAGGDGRSTRVETAESWSGVLPRLLPGPMGRSVRTALRDALTALRAEAEERVRS